MFNFILLIGAFGLFMSSFILLLIDLLSTKKDQNRNSKRKFTKKSAYSVALALIALILLVFVSFSY